MRYPRRAMGCAAVALVVSLAVPDATRAQPQSADVAVTVSVDPDRARPGEDLTYTFQVVNTGPDAADGVALTGYLPESPAGESQIEVVSTDAPGSCQVSAPVLTCDVGAMAVGASRVFTVSAYALVEGLPVVVAEVSSTGSADPVAANNTSSVLVDTRRDGSAGAYPFSAQVAAGVNLLTGELVIDEAPTLRKGGDGFLVLDMQYASRLHHDTTLPRPFGPNWTFSFNWGIDVRDSYVNLVTPDGEEFIFRRSGDSWLRILPRHGDVRLVEEADGSLRAVGPIRWMAPESMRSGSGTPERLRHRDRLVSLSWSGTQLTAVSHELGHALGFTYDAAGHIVSATDGSRSVTFEYDAGRLSAMNLPGGMRTEYTYDPASPEALIVARIVDGETQTYRQEFGQVGGRMRVVSQTDPEGNTTTFDYSDGVSSVHHPDGSSTAYSHDSGGRLTGIDRPDGSRVSIGYTADGLRASVVTDGWQMLSAYDTRGRLTEVTGVPDGAVSIRYAPDDLHGFGSLVSSIDWPGGERWDYEYDTDGRLLRATDPEGAQTSYEYDGLGRLTATTNPAGGRTELSYGGFFVPASITDAFGATTSFVRDEAGRVIQAANPDGTTRSMTWDDAGRLTSETDEAGHTTAYGYDKSHRLTRGRFTQTFLPSGTPIRAKVDLSGRPSGVTDALGYSAEVTYDPMGRVSSLTDRAGRVTSWTYDAKGAWVTRTLPGGLVQTVTRDALGRITSFAEAPAKTWVVAHDLSSGPKPKQTTSPSGRARSIAWDARGDLGSVSDARGTAVSFARDVRGQITGILVSDGVGVTVRPDAWGLPTLVSDGLAEDYSRSFDQVGRITGFRASGGGATSVNYGVYGQAAGVVSESGTVTLSRDDAGRLTAADYPDGTSLSYEYDADGLLVAATGITLGRDARGSLVESNGFTTVPGPDGRPVATSWPLGQTVTYAYDAAGRLKSVADWTGPVTAVSFSYDEAGRLTGLDRANGVHSEIRRDTDGFIGGISETSAQCDCELAGLDLARDASGLVTNATRRLPLTLVPAPFDQKRSFGPGGRAVGDIYDESGRRVGGLDGHTFGWDDAGRMTRAGVREFEYDAFGRTISESGEVAKVEVRGWDYTKKEPIIGKVADGSGAAAWRYVHTPEGRLLYRIADADSSRQFYHFDELGHTTVMTDDDGRVIASWLFDPYGRLLASEAAPDDNPFTFGGLYGVETLGDDLYRMGGRVYDGRTGTFLSPSPVADPLDPQALVPYAFAAQNPMRYVSPSGTVPLDAIGGMTAVDGAGGGPATAAAAYFHGDTFLGGRPPSSGGYQPGRMEAALLQDAVRASRESRSWGRVDEEPGDAGAFARSLALARAAADLGYGTNLTDAESGLPMVAPGLFSRGPDEDCDDVAARAADDTDLLGRALDLGLVLTRNAKDRDEAGRITFGDGARGRGMDPHPRKRPGAYVARDGHNRKRPGAIRSTSRTTEPFVPVPVIRAGEWILEGGDWLNAGTSAASFQQWQQSCHGYPR